MMASMVYLCGRVTVRRSVEVPTNDAVLHCTVHISLLKGTLQMKVKFESFVNYLKPCSLCKTDPIQCVSLNST